MRVSRHARRAARRDTLLADMGDRPERFDDAREPKRGHFPRRDDDGRVLALVDLVALTTAGLVIGAVILVAMDASGAALGWGTFGQGTGWLILVLPAWLFLIDEMRAWRGVHGRIAAAAAGGLVAMAAGMLVASVSPGPPLVTGGVGAAVAALVYAVWWFHGIRWLARREGSMQ